MLEPTSLLTIILFMLTVTFVIWRPGGINEAVPATIGAFFILMTGSVSLTDLGQIAETISGAAITIMATIVMAIVLESFGFFTWTAEVLAYRARGSGIKLFWYVNILCFLMTLFVNNDGSILITTPILIILLNNLGLKHHQQTPYLMSGALIATASSAPIGVSNIVNLIALKIVDMDLYLHTAMMFVPATTGLLFLGLLLFLVFYKKLPKVIPTQVTGITHPLYHPLKQQSSKPLNKENTRFMLKILLFVFFIRISLFVASYFGIPVSLMAVIGSAALLGWRWWYLKISPTDMLRRTPWYILIFAFSMYVAIYSLHNIGLTTWLIGVMDPIVSGSLLHASVMMGGLSSILSNLFNNHPALMIATLTLTNMGLDPLTLKISYLANVIGSDMGSLLLPMGTLATIMWMHIVKEGGIKMSWRQYIKVTLIVIPPTTFFTLVFLYYWVSWLF